MRIDQYPFAMLVQLAKLILIFDQKSLQQEWCVDPRAVQIGDKHADLDVLRINFLGHGWRGGENGMLGQ